MILVVVPGPWDFSSGRGFVFLQISFNIIFLRNDSYHDSPPRNQRFCLTNVSWLLDTRRDTIEKDVSIYFLVCKDVSIDDVGVSRDIVYQEIRPGAGFETADFVKEK